MGLKVLVALEMNQGANSQHHVIASVTRDLRGTYVVHINAFWKNSHTHKSKINESFLKRNPVYSTGLLQYQFLNPTKETINF